jgi:SAM-dependent methyltransferase
VPDPPVRLNDYSPQWFELFLSAGEPAQTEREVSFLAGALPLPAFRRVLDVCCGTGRHAQGLARRGDEVTGVDRDEGALARARLAEVPGTVFLQRDMRQLEELHGSWDAVVNLWASFGYFDPDTNRSVLRAMRRLLRPAGRLILDLYNRSHFEGRTGQRLLKAGGGEVLEVRTLLDGRLDVRLEYLPGGGGDHFSWEVFAAGELAGLGREAGLELVHACSGFDEAAGPTPYLPRMQALFVR